MRKIFALLALALVGFVLAGVKPPILHDGDPGPKCPPILGCKK